MKDYKKGNFELAQIVILLIAIVATLATIFVRKNKSHSTKQHSQNQTQKGDIHTYNPQNKNKKNEDENDDENYEENNENSNISDIEENGDKENKNKGLIENEIKNNSEEEDNNSKKSLEVLSCYETKMANKQEREKNRIHNIKTAAKFLDGVTIKPNSEFSFHKNIWDNKKFKQYRYADTIGQNGMDKGLGGGVCQVSSTLHIALLLAGFTPKERHCHSKQVTYTPTGLDASYVTGAKDLKFINTRKTPIKIKSYFTDSSIKIEILGTKEDNENLKIVIHPAKTSKKSKNLLNADVWIETKRNGKTVKTNHVKSTYNTNK